MRWPIGSASDPASPCPVTSISTYQGCASRRGLLCPGTSRSRKSMMLWPISSNEVMDSPSLAFMCTSRLEAGRRIVYCDPGRLRLAGLGKQPQHRRRDDTERPLAADEKLLHVVAGVVLAQPAQAVPNAAVGQHHLEPQHEIARIAVAQHLDAAGIGRNVAADLARALRPQAQGEQAPRLRGRRLDLLQHDAGLDRHRVVDKVGVADRPHARRRHYDLAHVFRRQSAVGHARITALRHDRGAALGADLDNGGHLLGGARP